MRHSIGDSGRLIKALPTKCCAYVIPVGSNVTILKRASDQPGKPRSVFVQCDGTLHTVKLSKIWFEGELVQEAS